MNKPSYFLDVSTVFKYLADKYLQRLKQQSAEETEVVHTTSNKIGTAVANRSPDCTDAL